jgi:hypothetical protein
MDTVSLSLGLTWLHSLPIKIFAPVLVHHRLCAKSTRGNKETLEFGSLQAQPEKTLKMGFCMWMVRSANGARLLLCRILLCLELKSTFM